jgi:hypothetical protein
MTMASLLSAPTAPLQSRPARKVGRPRVSEIPAERARHIEVATWRLVHGHSLATTAEAHGISERTVCYWTRLALTYPEAPDYLVRLASQADAG